MRIGFNALLIRPGIGGVVTYAEEMIKALSANAGVTLVVFGGRQWVESLEVAANVERVPVYEGFSQKQRILGENLALRPLLAKHKIEVLFSVGLPPLLAPGVPEVFVVHDLQDRWMPENYPLQMRLFRRAALGLGLRRHSACIAISEFVRNDIVSRYRGVEAKVFTVYNGLPTDLDNRADTAVLRQKHQLTKPYLCYPAATWMHKNHDMLLQAFARFVQEHGTAVDLILIGAQTENYAGIEARIRERGLTEVVKHLGYLPRNEVSAVLSGAEALVFPSRFEGFGLPVLEAFYLGTPVIALDLPALREVAKDAAVLLPNEDPKAWADAIAALLQDQDRRRTLVERGWRQAQGFLWSNTAAQALGLMQQIRTNELSKRLG